MSHSRNRTRTAQIAAAVLAIALLVIVRSRDTPDPASSPAALDSGASTLPSNRTLHAPGPSPASSQRRATRPADLPGPSNEAPGPGASRKERARFTLASYLDWARYPPGSRPARERPDRQKPHSAPVRKLPLSNTAVDPTGAANHSPIELILAQSHYYLAGDETAVLSLACRRDEIAVPCTVSAATAEMAEGSTHQGDRAPGAAPVIFTDDGAAPDRAANDGVWTAALAPARAGFANLHGPLRITVVVLAEGARGTADFQLSYTGEPPALFTGKVRETLANGSLSLCVEVQVRSPGRYVLDGRVDGVEGETFAFVSFNDLLQTGRQEACFTVFGKLVRDEGAAAPFTLRDVEGFLLREDAFPDRSSMPTLEGAVHTTKAYAAADFSGDEWEDPVKERTRTQLAADADAAE